MTKELVEVAALTSPGFDRAAANGVVILLPVGSVEPHGPHLPLGTDTLISQAAAVRAVAVLAERGQRALVAPAIPYGVTECAHGFAGAVSIPAAVLTAYVAAVADGFRAAGAAAVCVVNNHLEPAHDAALTAAQLGRPWLGVACPLRRTWARQLTPEFKSGACHAGQYETSIVMAADPTLVDEPARLALPEVPISLSDKLRAGVTTFAAMGMTEAYAGSPAGASAAEGETTLQVLAQMVVAAADEALRGADPDAAPITR